MTEFDQVITPHLKKLRKYIGVRLYQKLKRYVDVDDVMQEVLISANRRFEEYKKKNISFDVWIYKIALDKIIETYRFHTAQKRDFSKEVCENNNDNEGESLWDATSDCESPYALAVIDENTSLIKQAFNRMDGQDKEILYLRYINRLSNREIAELTGISKYTISMRYLRALERLAAQNKNNHNLKEILCQK